MPSSLYNDPVEPNPKPDHVRVPRDLWDEIVEFIDNHVDVVDRPDNAGVRPNRAMTLRHRIEQEV